MRAIAIVLVAFALAGFLPPAHADAIWDHKIAEGTIAAIQHNQNVNITFSYEVTNPGGVRIWARPITADTLTPNYAAHGSPVYPVGTGTSSAWFTITGGEVHVDQVRVLMTNSTQSANLVEWFVPASFFFGAQTLVGVEPAGENVPLTFALHQNFPNPLNPGTTILYDVPLASHVSVKVLNSLGQEITTLADGPAPRGRHRVQFDGSSLHSGVYFVRLLAEGYRETRRLVLLR